MAAPQLPVSKGTAGGEKHEEGQPHDYGCASAFRLTISFCLGHQMPPPDGDGFF